MSESGPRGMFGIGEFSRIAGMTVKTLRFYHEQGLLVPVQTDPQSGYRYYDVSQLERARAIAYLRSLEFSIDQIKEILGDSPDTQGRLLDAMIKHKALIRQRIQHLRGVVRSLDRFITEERQAAIMAQTSFEVQEKSIDPMLIAGIRMKGRYDECGKAFGRIYHALGRYCSGKPMMLHYDTEYKENDADFEACVPLKQKKAAEGVSVREIPGGRCVSLLHQGPYDQLGGSYARILKYIKDKGYTAACPSREVYLKGPGMIFKGNPKKYLTEIEFIITS